MNDDEIELAIFIVAVVLWTMFIAGLLSILVFS